MTEERYTFTMDQGNGTIITLTGNKTGIDDVLEDFKTFLLGCTYDHSLVDDIWREQELEPCNGN